MWSVCFTLSNCHQYLIGDFIEDLIFRDLGALGGLWHNWGWYGAPICIFIEVLTLQQIFSNHEHGVFRDPSVGVYNLIIEQGKTPIVWPMISSQSIHYPHLTAYVLASNATFGSFITYGMLRWRRQLDKQKKKE